MTSFCVVHPSALGTKKPPVWIWEGPSTRSSHWAKLKEQQETRALIGLEEMAFGPTRLLCTVVEDSAS